MVRSSRRFLKLQTRTAPRKASSACAAWTVRVEAVARRACRMFGAQGQVRAELHDAPGAFAGWAAHHGDQEAAVRKGVELVGDRRLRRIGGAEETRRAGTRDVEEEHLGLPAEDREQTADAEHAAVRREPHVMRLVAGCARTGQLDARQRPAVRRRALVEIDHSEEVGRLAGLVAGPDVERGLGFRGRRAAVRGRQAARENQHQGELWMENRVRGHDKPPE